jgi:hypothetical protein
LRELCGVSDSLDGGPDVLLCVERPDTESDCAADIGCPKLLVDQWRAVKAGPAGNVVVNVEQRPDVPSVHAVHAKEQNGDVIGEIILAIQGDPRDGGESVAQHPSQLHLVLVNGIKPLAQDPL